MRKTRPFPSRPRLIFALLVLIRLHYLRAWRQLISSKNTLTKEKERRKRNSEGEERRRREKAMVALLVFIMAPLEFFLTGKKLLLDTKDSFGGNVFRNPARFI